MHSFAPSLSFLLSIFTLALQLAFTGLTTANAAQLSTFNHTASPRDVGVAGHNAHRRRHADIGAALPQARSMLYPGRRAAGADFTYFKTGLGACGHVNVPGDFIVALNMEEFDSGNHCGAAITIIANGKTAHATIQDRCVRCGPNNLDFTEGLYAFFDPTMNGVVHGSWEYGSGPAAPSKPPVPPTTSKVQPSSTKAHSTTSEKATPSSSSVTSSSTQQQTSASVTTAPSTTPTAASLTDQTPTGNLANLFGALVNVGGLMINTVPSSA